jgi:hypothetical protein
MAQAGQQCQRRARHVGIHEEAHGLRGEQMKGLLFGEFANEFEGSANVFGSEVVFLSQLLKGHATSKAADNKRDRHPCASDNGFAVTDGRVNDDAVVCVHNSSISFHTLNPKAIWSSRFSFSRASATAACVERMQSG